MPIVFSPLYVGLVVVMAYELSRDVLRASQLVQELQVSEAGLRESEARMSLAVDAGDFGIWIRDFARDEMWASDKWRELFGFGRRSRWTTRSSSNGCTPTIATCSGRRSPWRPPVPMEANTRSNTGVRPPDGSTRWISSLGRVETDATWPAGADAGRLPRDHRA